MTYASQVGAGGQQEVLRRTRRGVDRCLAHKHIVLIGDSRVRYQYMSLASYLATGSWMKCADYGHDEGAEAGPCDLIDQSGGRSGGKSHLNLGTRDWNAYYNSTNVYLQGTAPLPPCTSHFSIRGFRMMYDMYVLCTGHMSLH